MTKSNEKFLDQIDDLEGVSIISGDKFTTIGSVPEDELFFIWREGNIQQGVQVRIFIKHELTILNVFTTSVALDKRGITLQEFVDTARVQLMNSFHGEKIVDD